MGKALIQRAGSEPVLSASSRPIPMSQPTLQSDIFPDVPTFSLRQESTIAIPIAIPNSIYPPHDDNFSHSSSAIRASPEPLTSLHRTIQDVSQAQLDPTAIKMIAQLCLRSEIRPIVEEYLQADGGLYERSSHEASRSGSPPPAMHGQFAASLRSATYIPTGSPANINAVPPPDPPANRNYELHHQHQNLVNLIGINSHRLHLT
jgi:hypothetical protein